MEREDLNEDRQSDLQAGERILTIYVSAGNRQFNKPWISLANIESTCMNRHFGSLLVTATAMFSG